MYRAAFLIINPAVEITPIATCSAIGAAAFSRPLAASALPAMAWCATAACPIQCLLPRVQHAPKDLPADTRADLLGSRYCDTDRLSYIAWQLFEKTPPGWARVQAICDFVHRHIAFGYEHARASKTAWEAYAEGKGVCCDDAHWPLRLPLDGIPARHCTGYLSNRHAETLGRGRFRRLV